MALVASLMSTVFLSTGCGGGDNATDSSPMVGAASADTSGAVDGVTPTSNDVVALRNRTRPTPTPSPAPAPTPSPTPAPTPSPTSVGSASLTWATSNDSNIKGYRVYYGTAPRTYAQAAGAGVSAGNTTNYTVNGLQPGTLYYFAVASVDAAGHDSKLSNESAVLAK